jgi:hypothetical protein
VSYCTSACCLAHRRRVFVQLWPPSMAFWWLHTDLTRCASLPEQEDPAAVLVPDGEGGAGWALSQNYPGNETGLA